MNVLRHPNTTNIHTHGLHVSSMAPGDDPFQIIAPGSELTSHFQIPAYHMGGTHWYHPHHHGSTALQTGGGAHGIIIVCARRHAHQLLRDEAAVLRGVAVWVAIEEQS